jgi:hypothetical protein
MGSLASEAEAFHRVLFDEPIPAEIVGRYIEAHEYVFTASELGRRRHESETIETILRRQLDVEAVEMAFRRKGPRHLLTQKFHILLYLVESYGEYASHFYNRERRLVRSYLVLGLLVLQTAFKFVKGMFLIWKYRLV